jgi:hypothetical protein
VTGPIGPAGATATPDSRRPAGGRGDLWNLLHGSTERLEPIPRRTNRAVRCLGAVRLPIAGPYRPMARLYRFPDGRLLWHVRLWEYDRAVPHLVATDVLVRYVRNSGFSEVAREIDRLVGRARALGGA